MVCFINVVFFFLSGLSLISTFYVPYRCGNGPSAAISFVVFLVLTFIFGILFAVDYNSLFSDEEEMQQYFLRKKQYFLSKEYQILLNELKNNPKSSDLRQSVLHTGRLLEYSEISISNDILSVS